MDLGLVVAIALLVLGVVGSVAPLVPGPALSLLGVYGYWWHTGYAEPGGVFLAVVTLLGLFAVVAELLGGAISARVGGASTGTTLAAAVASVVLLFFLGPLGIVVGVVGTVFAIEFYRTADAERAARTSLYTIVGMLASTVVQVLLTASILIAFVVRVAVF